jgi:hypothetical protein
MFKKIIFGLVILVVVVLAAAYFYRNMIVERAIEEGGNYALGVPTSLGSASLSIGAGSLDLDDYEVSNPKGFDDGDIFVVRHGYLDVDAGSIFDDQVVIDSLVLEGVKVNIEQDNDKGNYAVIMNNVKQKDFGQASESERKYRIGLIALRNVEVNAAINLLGKNQYQQSFSVDNFTIRDIGTDGGASVGRITAVVLREVLSRAVSEGRGRLPGQYSQKLKDISQGKLDEIKKDVVEEAKDLGKSLLGGDK